MNVSATAAKQPTPEPELEVHSLGSGRKELEGFDYDLSFCEIGYEDYDSDADDDVFAMLRAATSTPPTITDKPHNDNGTPDTADDESIAGSSAGSSVLVPCATLLQEDSNVSGDSDDDSTLVDIGDAFRDAIASIREQAAKMNTVMAVDQLDTMKKELVMLKHELADRGKALDEMKALNGLKDDRIATLGLEASLYQAEARKLREQLSHALQRVADMQKTTADDVTKVTAQESHSVDASDANMDTLSEVWECTGQATMRPPSVGASSMTQTVYSRHSEAYIMEPIVPAREKNFSCLSKDTVLNLMRLRKNSKRRSTRHTDDLEQSKLFIDLGLDYLPIEDHVEHLSRRLRACMDTSDELRRRLAILSKYYEGLIRKLKQRTDQLVVENKHISRALSQKLKNLEQSHNITFRGTTSGNIEVSVHQ